MKTFAVIFDMDGVLVDSYTPHYETWRISAAKRGIVISPAQFTNYFGLAFAGTLQAMGLDDLSANAKNEWHAEMVALYRQIITENFPAIAGVSELLAQLHSAGFKLGIGSAGPRANVEFVREKLPNGKLFTAWTCGDDVTHQKPHPEVFLRTAEKLNLPPHQCAVIEDSTHGLTAARAAGMKVIAITTTSPRPTVAPYADLVIDRMDELSPSIIHKLLY